MNNVIIGAGELGSRHLQGLLQYTSSQEIYVVDLAEEALQTAKNRAEEVEHHHQVHYLTDSKLLPHNLDLVIVATTSAVREAVIASILPKHAIRYLVLEKVLFQQTEAYHRVADLLLKHQVPTWVNHPRRMYDHYEKLRHFFAQSDAPVNMHVAGGNWGLGCNALHMIDLAVFINNSQVATIDASLLDAEVQEGKRKGYKEFTGTITGTLQSGAFFSISSFPGNRGPLTVYFSAPNSRCLVQEGGTAAQVLLTTDNKFSLDHTPIRSFYQSELTATVARQLIETGDCQLPDYANAKSSHVPFIETMLEKYNQLTGINTDICPIT
jgi:predicted dehydrogenase